MRIKCDESPKPCWCAKWIRPTGDTTDKKTRQRFYLLMGGVEMNLSHIRGCKLGYIKGCAEFHLAHPMKEDRKEGRK